MTGNKCKMTQNQNKIQMTMDASVNFYRSPERTDMSKETSVLLSLSGQKRSCGVYINDKCCDCTSMS